MVQEQLPSLRSLGTRGIGPAGAADAATVDSPASPAPSPTPQPSSPAGRMTILLMGIDQRPDEAASGGDPGRTDSMVLVSIDFDSHLVSMVSIPRDGFVVIPGYGNERVNAAYTYGELGHRGGGPALAERIKQRGQCSAERIDIATGIHRFDGAGSLLGRHVAGSAD